MPASVWPSIDEAMKTRWSMIVPLFLISGCAGGPEFAEPEAPANVIPRDTFMQVLTEVHLIEGVLKQRLFRNDDEDLRIQSHYAEMFERWGVTEERYTATYTWWYQRPEALDGLLEEVAENLTLLERKLVEEESPTNPGVSVPSRARP